jgi:hypothetical protein
MISPFVGSTRMKVAADFRIGRPIVVGQNRRLPSGGFTEKIEHFGFVLPK